jgi:septal ring factor EnvC (AmiA/AmiB activator)
VRGELANRFGSPRSDGGVLWKGLFIAARAGEEVRAVADGRVVFSDWLRGFGNLLIIDHGDAFMSLYGNNEALFKRVGDIIHGGEAVAAVGNSGGNARSGLYFELRHQGKPLDPLDWVKMP